MAATTATANSGAAIENAALSLEAKGSNETVTKLRLANANPRRTKATRATIAIFNSRNMQASSVQRVGPEPDHARGAVRTMLDPLDCGSIEAFAHFLAGFEERRELLGDRHLVAGARIAAGAGLTLLGRERAEAAQLDALAAGEGVGDLAEYGVDDVLDVALIEMRIAGRHALHEFRLDHRTSPTRNDPEVSPGLHALKSWSISIAFHPRPGVNTTPAPRAAETAAPRTFTPIVEPHIVPSGETARDRMG